MKCQSCGKKEATVKYYENINGVKKVLNICNECATKVGLTPFKNIFSPMFMSIPDYIQEELKCQKCGYTLNDYTKTGLFGCPECYNTFNENLDNLFLKIHGKNRHTKVNTNTIKKKKTLENTEKLNRLDSLKGRLKYLVEQEMYEEAAVVRDEIKKLEKNKGE